MNPPIIAPTMPEPIDPREGRQLFGLNPDGYAAVRPDYPDATYALLTDSGALDVDTATLEIGAGAGLASRKLIELGANPITLVEPDRRFSHNLNRLARTTPTTVTLIHNAFEDLGALSNPADLVAVATAYHWLVPESRLRKIGELLARGGFMALWWHVFQDPGRPDPFHDATRTLLADLASSPSGIPEQLPFALDRDARVAEINDSGLFEEVICDVTRWTLTLSTPQVELLYESFSPIQRLPAQRRRELLDALMAVADTQFGGCVERPMTCPIYLARRCP